MLRMIAAAVVVVAAGGTLGGSTSPVTEGLQLAAGCQVVLFHSALGVRRNVIEWADMMSSRGYVVSTPDFFGGRTFDNYQEAMEEVQRQGGITAYMEWTARVGAELKGPVVFMGFSNGAGSAQYLAATYPEARGAVMMHGALPLPALGLEAWPSGVPVQVHYADGDPFRIPEAVEALAKAVQTVGDSFELFSYNLSGHLFADSDLPDYDPEASRLMAERAFRFLESRCT